MMIPPMLGITTILIKNSALVSAIGVGELFYQAMVLGGQTLRYFEFLTAIAHHVLRTDFAAEPAGSTPRTPPVGKSLVSGQTDRPAPKTSSEPMIACEGVRKSFGAFEALRGVDLAVARGEVLCVIGPSGGGKSTFLRTINALEQIDARPHSDRRHRTSGPPARNSETATQSRHGLSELQPVSAHDGAPERCARPGAVSRTVLAGGLCARRTPARTRQHL